MTAFRQGLGLESLLRCSKPFGLKWLPSCNGNFRQRVGRSPPAVACRSIIMGKMGYCPVIVRKRKVAPLVEN